MPIEKVVLALIVVVRKLCPYFLAHKIQVITNIVLKQIFRKSDVSGRMVRWPVELSEFLT